MDFSVVDDGGWKLIAKVIKDEKSGRRWSPSSIRQGNATAQPPHFAESLKYCEIAMTVDSGDGL